MGGVFLRRVGSPKGLCTIFILTVFQMFNKSKAIAGNHEGSSKKKYKWPISTRQDVKVGGGDRELETDRNGDREGGERDQAGRNPTPGR